MVTAGTEAGKCDTTNQMCCASRCKGLGTVLEFWALRIWILFFKIRGDQMCGGQKPWILYSCVSVWCLFHVFGGRIRVGFPVRE